MSHLQIEEEGRAAGAALRCQPTRRRRGAAGLVVVGEWSGEQSSAEQGAVE